MKSILGISDFYYDSVASIIIQKMISGEKISIEESGLSKREWNELMNAFGLREKIVE